MSDQLHALRVALVAILRADQTVQTVCGRRERLVSRIEAFDALPLPGLTYLVVVATPTGGSHQPVTVTVQLTAWAEGDGSGEIAADLLNAALAALTGPAFAARGLDVNPARAVRQDAPIDPQGSRRLAREDADLDLEVRVS